MNGAQASVLETKQITGDANALLSLRTAGFATDQMRRGEIKMLIFVACLKPLTKKERIYGRWGKGR